jgi:hypothetical protein
MERRGRIKSLFLSIVPDSPIGVLGERRILFEDAYVVLRVPITAPLGSVTLPWVASHSFVDLRT